MENATASICAVCSSPILAQDESAKVGQVAVHVTCYPERQWAESRGRRQHPICSLCHIPLVAGDRVIYGGDELVHVECHDRSRAGDVVAGFLGARPGQAFCHACLATRVALPGGQVRKTMWALRAAGGFAVRPDTCSACGAPRVTIAALEGGSAPAVNA